MALDPRDLDDLVAIAKTGSLSAAAKKRGVAVSTISRRIEALEANLRLRLIDRFAHGARLTRAGNEIASAAEPLAAQIDRVRRVAEALHGQLAELPVRVSATEFVISDVLAPRLDRLWATGGQFAIHLQSEAAVVSLAGREADIAIRMSRPEGASLVIQKLPTLQLGLYGKKDEMTGLGLTKLLVYDESYGRLPELDWLDSVGLRQNVIMRTASTRGLLTAALSGAGAALLPKAIAKMHPELSEIDVGSSPPSRTAWLTVHRDLQRQPSIRRVHHWIRQCFADLVSEARN